MAIRFLAAARRHRFVLFSFLFSVYVGHAQEGPGSDQETQQTRSVPSVSQAFFKEIQRADALSLEEDHGGAVEVLQALLDNRRLTDYERANGLMYLSIAQLHSDNLNAAIESLEALFELDDVELQLRKRATLHLSQFYGMAERYEDALRTLEAWFAMEPSPGPMHYITYAQYNYQLERYSAMIKPIETAIELAAELGTHIKEDWYVLLNYAYFQQEDYAAVRDIQTILLQNWPRKRYWMSLAGAYTELGDEERLYAAFDAAHTQGLLTSESELVTMAQLYLQQEVPYKAGRLLETEIASGRVSADAKNYRLLSQAWTLAQEDDKAIGTLVHAARLSGDGELYSRLGNAYFNLGRHEECANAIMTGLAQGGVRNPDYAYISLGICLYHLGRLAEAIEALEEAAKTDRSTRSATQWIHIIRSERRRLEIIADTEAATREQQRRVRQRLEAGDSS